MPGVAGGISALKTVLRGVEQRVEVDLHYSATIRLVLNDLCVAGGGAWQ